MSNQPIHTDSCTIGVISDTHGLFRPEIADLFRGVDLIVHAGDIGHPDVLNELKKVAPVKAVRGNMDAGDWAFKLPASEIIEIGDATIYVLHDLYRLDLDPSSADIHVVISGHTHRFSSERKNGVPFINPGSAGPFKPPLSVAMLSIYDKSIESDVIDLNP